MNNSRAYKKLNDLLMLQELEKIASNKLSWKNFISHMKGVGLVALVYVMLSFYVIVLLGTALSKPISFNLIFVWLVGSISGILVAGIFSFLISAYKNNKESLNQLQTFIEELEYPECLHEYGINFNFSSHNCDIHSNLGRQTIAQKANKNAQALHDELTNNKILLESLLTAAKEDKLSSEMKQWVIDNTQELVHQKEVEQRRQEAKRKEQEDIEQRLSALTSNNDEKNSHLNIVEE